MTDPKPARPKRRLPWWSWVLIGAAGVTGVVALLGGFNEVPIERLPQIDLGVPFVGNEVSVQVNDIYLSSATPVTGYEADDGEVYLVVEATVENVTTSPNIFLNRALRVIVDGAVDGDTEPYTVVALRDGDNVAFLQAGLPVEVAFLWPVAANRIDPGDEISLGIFERYDMVDDPRFDDSKTNPVPVVRLSETVGDFR